MPGLCRDGHCELYLHGCAGRQGLELPTARRPRRTASPAEVTRAVDPRSRGWRRAMPAPVR
ncbi:DUF3253 domain-containing protein [Rhodococcus sp. T2V]|uniref:DUF3253 domain-containing protein n=1 Tax=Rhodococcus sp. T2V TaxID=3034164 RepID=UPI0034E25F03